MGEFGVIMYSGRIVWFQTLDDAKTFGEYLESISNRARWVIVQGKIVAEYKPPEDATEDATEDDD